MSDNGWWWWRGCWCGRVVVWSGGVSHATAREHVKKCFAIVLLGALASSTRVKKSVKGHGEHAKNDDVLSEGRM